MFKYSHTEFRVSTYGLGMECTIKSIALPVTARTEALGRQKLSSVLFIVIFPVPIKVLSTQ